MSLGFKSQSVGVRANLRTVDIWSMYSRTLLDILFLIWGQTVADYKMLSFRLSINVIIIVVSFKILDLCPIALFQQLWNTLYILKPPRKLFTFLDFCNFQFGRLYLRNCDTDLCKIDTIILVSLVFHDAIFTTRTSWSLLYLNKIVTSVAYFANGSNQGFSNGALGSPWGPRNGSLGPTSRGLH